MSTNEMSPPQEEALESAPEAPPVTGDPSGDQGGDPPGLEEKMAAAARELEQPPPPEDEPDAPDEGGTSVARLARDERMRLMSEYLQHFFLEDLPPIDPQDPFNQGIYMRYRINQMRSAQGKEPVV